MFAFVSSAWSGLASLVAPAPAVGGAGTAAVGGAGTAGADGRACDVAECALAWALQDAAIAAAVDALVAAEAAAPDAATRLARELRTDRSMTAEAAAAHLAALRAGNDVSVLTASRLEREYAALFKPVHTARARLLRGIVSPDFTSGLPVPSPEQLRSGRRVPAARVAALLGVKPAEVVAACEAVAAGVAAGAAYAATLAAELPTVSTVRKRWRARMRAPKRR